MLSVCDWIWNSRQGKAPLAPSIEAQQMLGIIGCLLCQMWTLWGLWENWIQTIKQGLALVLTWIISRYNLPTSAVSILISISLQLRCHEVTMMQPQIAVAKSDSFDVLCSVEQELKGCYIKTPKNDIWMIFHGAKYDNNRIFQTGNIANECRGGHLSFVRLSFFLLKQMIFYVIICISLSDLL